MSLINGIQEPRFVLLDGDDNVVDDFVLERFSTMEQRFTPEIIRHPLDDGTTDTEFLGFWYRCEIYYEQIEAAELQKLRKLLDSRAYRKARLYPHATEKAHYFLEVSLDSEEVDVLYFHVLRMRDFTLRIISTRRVDWLPLELPTFVSWGNISLRFADMNMQFDTLT